MLKSSAFLNEFSTNSLPSTAFRISRPFSNVALSAMFRPSQVKAHVLLPRIHRATATVTEPRRRGSAEPGGQCSTPRLRVSAVRENPALSPDLYAGPLLDDLGDRREVGVGAELRLGDRQHLPDGSAGDHRHAERLGLVHAQTYVLIGQPGRKAEVERPRQDRPRELVLGGAVASAA